MDRFIIIGRSSCHFCIHAVDYCIAKRAKYIFLDYSESSHILEEYKEFYGQKTVPIILSNNISSGLVKVIGGYTDLLECELL